MASRLMRRPMWIVHRLKFKGEVNQESTFRWKFSELTYVRSHRPSSFHFRMTITRTTTTTTTLLAIQLDSCVLPRHSPILFSFARTVVSSSEGKLLDNFRYGRASPVPETFLKRRVAGIVVSEPRSSSSCCCCRRCYVRSVFPVEHNRNLTAW